MTRKNSMILKLKPFFVLFDISEIAMIVMIITLCVIDFNSPQIKIGVVANAFAF